MDWLVWLIILVVILVFEARALFSGKINDTLSESVWWLRTRVWGRLVLFPLWAWLTWHFFMEPSFWNPQAGVWIDDYIVVGVGFVLALIRDYDDYHKSDADLPEVERLTE
jgi:hypothetical protein